ncbi:uncharacterized protein LAJ45_02733 [Morchella importuna]|uniref:DUF788-domain-containing protein n=1 Tax=Morchella conica CCBAS932 TaxID=1392247 RepID=A0A3N4KQ81_9PEZI|nr:uncharacterized protein LAJ45_02733 [Morchella importuna]KAH8153146.1 hypothetical protein LAJ45_02733 [Morchella importuna]RPB12754.1 hypothetical protein P167DRAFT_545339 [Morchella conica CCBAS932]
MANKASKSLARANARTLTRTHTITASLHALFILYRLLFRHGSWRKYLVLSLPSLVIEYYLERLGRPTYTATGDLRSPGEDMEAKGVTEYLWDVVYATWVVMGLVGVAGEWAWWLWTIVPAYAGYLAFSTYNGMRNGLMPGMPAAPEGPPSAPAAGMSNRQKKSEKRGGQKIRYQ